MSAASAGGLLQRDLSGRRLGRYEVLMQLASGGMATVYVARAQGVAGFERLVAVKVLHPHLAHDEEFISMFLDEARLAARIRHPNVVPTLDISDTQGDGYFLVMEYIEGDHLGAILREAARAGKNLPIPITARLLIDALEGLGAAHQLTDDGQPLGLVHRDVSPHNVLVGGDGIARITDFGVAKAEVRLSSTRDGQFKGKLSYMAPEQASTGKADQRSDLFSMGIVLWEALTGRRLFRADNNGELLNRLLHDPIAAPSTYVPEAAPFDAVCAKALERDPDARFQTSDELIDAIETAAAQVGGVASPRAVGRLVRELLGPKLDAQRERIKASGDALGKSQLKPGLLPLPEGGTSPGSTTSPSQVGRALQSGLQSGTMPVGAAHTPSAVRPIGDVLPPEDQTIGAKPSNASQSFTVEAQPAASRRRAPWILMVVAVFVLAAVGGYVAVTSSGSVAEVVPPHGATAAPPSPSERAAGDVAAPELAAPQVAPSDTEAPGDAVGDQVAGAEGAGGEGGAGEAGAGEVGAGEVGAGEVGAGEAVRAETPRDERSSRRRRARGGSSETRGTATTSSDDDDLLSNPYRR